MEIIIGSVPNVGIKEKKRRTESEGLIEAQVLHVRYPRKPYGLPPGGTEDRRQKNVPPDPSRGRIMTILIPEEYSIPQDVASGRYRVLLRFAQNRPGF